MTSEEKKEETAKITNMINSSISIDDHLYIVNVQLFWDKSYSTHFFNGFEVFKLLTPPYCDILAGCSIEANNDCHIRVKNQEFSVKLYGTIYSPVTNIYFIYIK